MDVPTKTMPAFILTMTVAAAAFCALGLAVVLVHSQRAGGLGRRQRHRPPHPLHFRRLYPLGEDPPAWIDFLGDMFPVKHLAEAAMAAFNPYETG